MFVNFIKLALRHMSKNVTYVFINILGLAVGIACFILIGLFVLHELSYDHFHENKKEIFRMVLDGKVGEQEVLTAHTPPPLAKTLIDEVPEVMDAVRMDAWGETPVKIGDRVFIEDGFAFADSTFFNIFSISLLYGDPEKVLNQPYTMVLSRSTALKYFGNENPVGEVVKVGTDTAFYQITGVFQDLPDNSHFNFNLLSSFVTLGTSRGEIWLNNNLSTYILTVKESDPEKIELKVKDILIKYVGPELEQIMGATYEDLIKSGGRYGMKLQNITDIHLQHEVDGEFKTANDRKYVYIFTIVAFAILVIAGINYMNLSTAQSANRAREVGMKKVVGSHKGALQWQFMIESILLSIMSLVVAIILVELVLQPFNNLLQSSLKIEYFKTWYTLPVLFVIAIIVGFMSGSYPAFYLASFRPVSVLSGSVGSGIRSGYLRSSMVVIQLAISIMIMAVTLVIFRQVQFMMNKDLGFNKEQLLVLRRANALGNKINLFINMTNGIPNVVSASHTTAIPGYPNNNNGYLIDAGGDLTDPDNVRVLYTVWTDHDYLKTMEFELVDGRFFSEEMATDSFACVINQSAVRYFGLEEPLKVRFIQPGMGIENRLANQVIGVVKDFHFQSLHDEISPHIFLYDGDRMNWGNIVIRIDEQNKQQTLNAIESVWKELTGNEPMQYFFLDNEFEKLYQEDKRTGRLALVFSILAIFIASLGLYGLTAFTIAYRTKEIGVRKVQGAKMLDIFLLLSLETAKLVLIASVLGVIPAYFFLKNWLENFYFRTTQKPMDYVIVIAIALFITWITISYRAFKAARTNPAEALRYE